MGFTHNCLQASCHTLHRQWFIDLCGCVTTVSISNTISPTIVVKEATTKLGSTTTTSWIYMALTKGGRDTTLRSDLRWVNTGIMNEKEEKDRSQKKSSLLYFK
jgi:hypothetical protein